MTSEASVHVSHDDRSTTFGRVSSYSNPRRQVPVTTRGGGTARLDACIASMTKWGKWVASPLTVVRGMHAPISLTLCRPSWVLPTSHNGRPFFVTVLPASRMRGRCSMGEARESAFDGGVMRWYWGGSTWAVGRLVMTTREWNAATSTGQRSGHDHCHVLSWMGPTRRTAKETRAFTVRGLGDLAHPRLLTLLSHTPLTLPNPSV